MKLVLLCSVLAFAPRVAAADPGDIVVDTPGERTTQNMLMLGGITGAALIAGTIGVYFHLDSKSLSNDISLGKANGKAWTSADQSKLDRAGNDRTYAGVAYGIGGAFLIGAVVTYIVTDPKSERTVIHPHTAVTPTTGGALLEHWWSF